MDKKQIGAELRNAREKRGLSQTDISKTLGMGRGVVSHIERGALSLETIVRYLFALDADMCLSAEGRAVVVLREESPRIEHASA